MKLPIKTSAAIILSTTLLTQVTHPYSFFAKSSLTSNAQVVETLVQKSERLPKKDFIKEVKKEYKKIKYIPKTDIGNYSVEVLDIAEIENGIKVTVRGWENGEQIGFGKDGTVDKETYRIIDPRILAKDPTGNIVRVDKNGGVSRFKEDLRTALLQVLAQDMETRALKFDSKNIISGKVGTTTTLTYPDGGTLTEDGRLQKAATDTWANVHDATTSDADNNTNPQNTCGRVNGGDAFKVIDRFGATFGDPNLEAGSTVDSATIVLTGTSVENGVNDGRDYLVVSSFTPASNNAFVSGDYDGFGTTALSDTIDFGSLNGAGTNTWTLNATGIAAIDITEINKFGFRVGHDIENVQPASGNNEFLCNTSENGGTSADPVLSIVSSLSASGGPVFFFFF